MKLKEKPLLVKEGGNNKFEAPPLQKQIVDLKIKTNWLSER